MKILKYCIVLVCVLSLWGCGKGNSSAPATVDPVSKKVHSDPNWLASTHKKTPANLIPTCAECHGGDFKGGIVNVGCTKCHLNGPGGPPPHDVGNGFQAAGLHGALARQSLAYCANCHSSGANQPFNSLTNTIMPSGCASAGCHFQNPNLAHPYGWIPGRGGSTTTSHAAAGDVITSCTLCHGANLDGAAGSIAPSCFQVSPLSGTACHFTKPVDVNGASLGCSSCHGNPPNSTSAAAAPNRAFRHTAHFANILVTGTSPALSCDACHSGFGAGTSNHATHTVFTSFTAAVALNALYNENGATASYSAATQRCTNVSCHGGKTITVNWKNATAFNQGNCNNCHTVVIRSGPTLTDYGSVPASYTGPYIGPFSGDFDPTSGKVGNLHSYHFFSFTGVPPQNSCKYCHSLDSGHYAFATLGHRTLPSGWPGGWAARTLTGVGISSYAAQSKGSCFTNAAGLPVGAGEWSGGCHDSGARPWFQ